MQKEIDSIDDYEERSHFYAHHPGAAVELWYAYRDIVDEHRELKKKYDDMVGNTIKSSNEMMGNWLHLLINSDIKIT